MKRQSSKRQMIFILSMLLYGFASLVTELIPHVWIGIFEISVEYFLFIPFSLAILLEPLPVALGAATGELIFSEILLGKFGGLGEFEKFIEIVIAIYLVGMLVKNPNNKRQLGVVSILAVMINRLMSATVDIVKAIVAVDDFEAVKGLPQSVYCVEAWECMNDILFSGILFCMIPTIYMVPKLYGKLEPLLGLPKKAVGEKNSDWKNSLKLAGCCVLGFLFAMLAEVISEADWDTLDNWNPKLRYLLILLIICVLFLSTALLWVKRNHDLGRE